MQNRMNLRARGKAWIFVGLACFVVAMGFAMNDDEKNIVDNAAILESNPDSPVYIENNQDLAEFASSGFGTPDDPFIIENLVIDCASYFDNGIYIRDTTAHFIVRNCFVSNTQIGWYGIFLLRVKHGIIDGNEIHNTDSLYFRDCENISIKNNYIQDNHNTGIFLYNSIYTTIQNNTLDSNERGIFLNFSPNNTIRSNKISGAHDTGIYISSSSRFTRVENNTVQGTRATSGSYEGIGMYVMSENNTFIDNSVLDNDGGFYDYSGIGLLVFSDGNHFKNNTVASSTGSGERSGLGFLFSTSSHNTLTLNTVRDNTGGGLLSGIGMLFLSSSNNKVNWSIIQGNQNSGIALSGSTSNNDIWLNGFFDNNGSGIQACDNGTSNSWYISNRGNYWSDFLVVNPGATPLNNIYWGANYLIDGSSGSFDWYSLITYHHGYLPSYPITIQDTADFQAYASCGYGTQEDPFILENLCINTTTMGSHGITIVGTNDFFTIRHCMFEDTDSNFGIYFSDVSNGFIEDCTCFKNYGGIYLFKCVDISVARSMVNDTVYGIYLYQTNNSLLLRNEVDTSDVGIYFMDAHFNKAIENFVHNCVECGFDHFSSSWNEISGNLIMDITGTSTPFTGVGIQMTWSEHVKLLNTTVMRCQAGSNSFSGNGGYMIHCSNITIQDCAFNLNDGGLEYKSGNGLYMDNITSSIINNTQLCDNAAGFTDSGNGLYLLSSSSNTISNCIAAGNYGTDSEAGNGFYLSIADNTKLLDCRARYNQNHVSGDYAGNGVLVIGSDNVEINNCTSRDNIGTSTSFTGNGVLIVNSDGAIMVNSHLHDNLGSSTLSGAGMLSISSDQGEFIGNHVHGNDDFGIYVNGMENLFYLNNLTDNSYTWQAQDYGNDNTWDMGGFGNYWGNYEIHYPNRSTFLGAYWEQPFEIVGSANSIDHYPLLPDRKPSNPLHITNDDELEAAASSGAGTLIDPFVISSLFINSSMHGMRCIDITSTTRPFVVRDCVLVNAELTGLCGIHVGYAADARVVNCSIMYCDIGIHLEDCVNVNLTSCTIEYIGSVGIACMVGERYTLVNNTVRHFEITGFAAYWCNDLSFINNEISLGTLGGPVQGCYFDQVNDSRVFNNSVHDLSGNTDMYSATGFMFWRTHNCIVDANQAFNLQAINGLNSANGFYLMLSNNITLEHNQAFNLTGSMTGGSSGNGFRISMSNDTVLQENNGYSTHGYSPNSGNGFQILNSKNCTLIRNLANGNSGDVDYSGNGFYIHESGYVNVLDNDAWENHGNVAYSGTGFLCQDSDHAFLANNSALNNSNTGFFLDSGIDASMFNNSASENSLHGVHLHGIDGFSIDGCQINANEKLGILVNQCLGFNFVDNTTLLGNLKWLYQQDSSLLLGVNMHVDRFGIMVSANDDLRYYSTGGSGTELDPFIIEDYNFNCTGMARHGIWITGTDAHFSLENCTILSTDPGYAGIFLENTSHAHVFSCNSSYNGRGVHFRNVNSSTIMGNEINHNIDEGILLNDSHDNNITVNNLLFNHICLQEDSSCTNNLVFGNTCDLLTPWWTSPSLPPPVPMHYRNGLNHTFSILWLDDYMIDEVIFHLDGINYTVEGSIGDNYSIEICDISGGIHQYRWFAKDTSRKMNQTALMEFNVLPVEPFLELRLNGTIGNFQGSPGSIITIEVTTNVQGGINIYNGSTYLCHQANTSWRFTHVGTLDIIACFSGNENYTGVNVSCKLKLTYPDNSPPDHQDLLIILAIITLVSAIALMIHIARKKQDKREPPPPPLLKKKPKDGECAWHGRKLREPSFSCSQCGVHYCLECVLKLLRERDTCHFCGKPIEYFRLMHVMMDINGNLSGDLEDIMKVKQDAGTLPPSYYAEMRGKIMEELQQLQAKQASGSIMKQKGSQQQSQNYYKKVRKQVMQQQETEENHE